MSGKMARLGRQGGLGFLSALAIVLAGALVIGGCVEQRRPAQTIRDVEPQDAFEMVRERQGSVGFVVLDVRTPEEFGEGHLENARNIDYYASDFRDRIDELDKSKTYVVYCRSGRRSAAARDIMEELGFKEVYNVLGGILRWTEQGLPLVR